MCKHEVRLQNPSMIRTGTYISGYSGGVQWALREVQLVFFGGNSARRQKPPVTRACI